MPARDDRSESLGAYGATAQPAIAERMAPQLTMVGIGSVSAMLAVVAVAAAAVVFPSPVREGGGVAWVIVALVAAVFMFAVCLGQLIIWRRAMASWGGQRLHDLHGAARLSWGAHLASYAMVLVVLISCMTASAAAGWSSTAALLLGLGLILSVAGQVLAAVQYLRPSGPPGTVPSHLRRLRELSERRIDHSVPEADERSPGPDQDR